MSILPYRGLWVCALLSLLVLTGCEVGPDYHKSQLPMPRSFQDRPDVAQAPLSRPVAAKADVSQWWMRFDDPELHSLIGRALRSNLNLQSLASRIRAAREQIVVAGAAEYPQLNATGLGAHVHSGSNLFEKLMGGSRGQGGSVDTNFFSAGFDATWELDIFGGTRRGIEVARAKAEAAVWTLRDGEVSLTAEVANDYLTLRATQTRLAIVKGELKREEGTLRLISARAKAGFVTQLDVNQQRTQVANAQAEVPLLQAEARAMIHALGVLLGQNPESLSAELSLPGPVPDVPTTLPVGLPSDLLRRRPDIRAAERKLAAASAQVGVAVADFYPKFNLLAPAVFASNHISDLFLPGNFTTLGVGLISFPLFAAGKIEANVAASKEQLNQAYLAYKQTVVQALQDAEDALVRYGADQRRLVALRREVTAATSSVHIARQQYRAGLVNFLNVLNAQAELLRARDSQAQAVQAVVGDLVAVYKALGGGWNKADIANTKKGSPG